MKSLHWHRSWAAALAGLALAAFHPTGYAADSADETRVADLAPAFRKATAAPAADDRAAPLTLFLEDPRGNAVRLIHVNGEGWKYAGGEAVLQRTASLSKTPLPSADATLGGEPLTVFIDGPSGY